MKVEPVLLGAVRSFVEEHHYSRSVNGVKVAQCFALYDGGELVGAAIFGALSTTSWKRYADSEREVVELRRLVCLDCCPPNTESWFLRRILRHMRFHSDYRVCISYADPRHGHLGVIYQAGNWSYRGQTAEDTVFVTPEGREYHSRALRTKYKGEFKPFVKRLRALHAEGRLKEMRTPGKHIYLFTLKGTHSRTGVYPKRK